MAKTTTVNITHGGGDRYWLHCSAEQWTESADGALEAARDASRHIRDEHGESRKHKITMDETALRDILETVANLEMEIR